MKFRTRHVHVSPSFRMFKQTPPSPCPAAKPEPTVESQSKWMISIFSLPLTFLPLNLCLVMRSWESWRQCLNTWPINSQWISGLICERCVDPGAGTSLSFSRCTCTACHWSAHCRTTIVHTPRPLEVLHLFHPHTRRPIVHSVLGQGHAVSL